MNSMIRKVLCILVIVLVLIPTIALAEKEVEVLLDGKAIQFRAAPYNVDGTMLVEFRTIFEEMGLDIHWEPTTKTAQGKKEGLEIQLQINNKQALVNGMTQELLVAPIIMNEMTFIPLRFVGEASDYDVNWNGENKVVTITSKDPSGNSSPNNGGEVTGSGQDSTNSQTTNIPQPDELDLTQYDFLRYEGEIEDGQWHGQGKLYDVDGTLWYEGEFKHNQRDGYGKLYWPHGELQYEGEWKEDKFHGYGTMYSLMDGSIVHQGQWENSTPVK